MMTSDFEQTDTGICKPVKVLSSSDRSVAVDDDAEVAMKLIVACIGTDDLRSLLNSNPSLIENAQDWAGDGLLAIAAWHGNIEVVQMLLLEFNANVNAENFKKTTPLHRASAGGCYSCVEILLNRGADVEFCDATGRRPVDVGSNDAVRDLIKERIRVAKEIVRQFHISLEKADKEFEEKSILMKQASEERKIASRLSQAVPVIFSGACDEEANGAYDPIYELHDQWPIYRKRDGKTEIILLYVASKSSWIIKTVYVGQSYDEVSLFDSPGNNADRRGKCLVTLFTGCPSFPELRLEGSNGISEACAPRRNGHEMSIVPESELIGALEMEKLKQMNNSLSSESLRDA